MFRSVSFDLYERLLLTSQAARKVNIARSLSKVSVIRWKAPKVQKNQASLREDVEMNGWFNQDFIIKLVIGTIREKF